MHIVMPGNYVKVVAVPLQARTMVVQVCRVVVHGATHLVANPITQSTGEVTRVARTGNLTAEVCTVMPAMVNSVMPAMVNSVMSAMVSPLSTGLRRA